MKTILDHENAKFTTDSQVRVIPTLGTSVPPEAKFVEATYSNGNTTVTYTWYTSSAKTVALKTITLNYSIAQDTSFVSSEWS